MCISRVLRTSPHTVTSWYSDASRSISGGMVTSGGYSEGMVTSGGTSEGMVTSGGTSGGMVTSGGTVTSRR